MQMMKVGMRDQHQVNGGRSPQLDPRFAQPLQHKQPAGKIRIDDNILPANLDEKAGMADERYPNSPLLTKLGLCAWPVRGVTAECRTSSAKRTRAFAENGIRKRWL